MWIRRRWLVIGLGVVVCLGVFFAITASLRPPTLADTVKALRGRRPVSEHSQMLSMMHVSSAGIPSTLNYRVQEFKFDESFDVVNERFKAELKPRTRSASKFGKPGSRIQMFSLDSRMLVLGKTITVREHGKGTSVSVVDIEEPGLFDKMRQWWDGLVGKKPPSRGGGMIVVPARSVK